MTDAIASGKSDGGNSATDMAGMMMGMQMAKEMMNGTNDQNAANQQQQSNQGGQQNQGQQQQQSSTGNEGEGSGSIPNFCPNCGSKTQGMNFCGNCGHKLV